MTLRRCILALHRDLGYFFTGVIVVYAISGLAVNHVDQWNPNFVIARRDVTFELPRPPSKVSAEHVLANLDRLGAADAYRAFDFPSDKKMKIYLSDGSILVNLQDGRGCYETIRRRPVLYEANRLHVNPAKWWRIFSDIFAGSLIVIALTGLLVARGSQGLLGRGKWLVGAGLIVPLAAMVFL
jgi:hypothetical protein